MSSVVTVNKPQEETYYVGLAQNCYIDAYINQEYTLKHLNLNLKFGSLGLGNQKDGPRTFIWEYGGENANYDKLEGFFPKSGGFDGHVWLEDANGLVYDYVRPMVLTVSLVRSLKIGFNKPCAIYGVSKEQLKRQGLVYLEASTKIQKEIKSHFERTSNIDEIFPECRSDPGLCFSHIGT